MRKNAPLIISPKSLDSCVIIPYVGIDDFKLGVHGVHEMKNKFGKGKCTRSWQKGYEAIIPIGHFRRTYEYPDLGLKFIVERMNRFGDMTANVCYLTPPCKYKTKKGVGIGSSLEEIKLEFGDVRIFLEDGYIDGVDTMAYAIHCIDADSHGSIYFYCYTAKEMSEFKVEKILMGYRKYQ